MNRPPGEAVFVPFAVTTKSGPHVTMQAAVELGGRLFTTTSSDSLKVKSARKHGHAAALIPTGASTWRSVAGRTEVLSPDRLFSSKRDPLSALLAVPAILGIAKSNLEQILGYLEAASAIPSSWYPQNRRLLALAIDRRVDLDGDEITRTKGTSNGPVPQVVNAPAAGLLAATPSSHRALVEAEPVLRMGFTTPDGPVVLPCRSLDDAGRFAVSFEAVSHFGCGLPGRIGIVADDSQSRRPDEKRGVLYRGDGALVAVDGAAAIIAVVPDRVTTWDGFDVETHDVSPVPA